MENTRDMEQQKTKNYVTSLKERMAYGGFFIGQNIIIIFVISFLTIFYTDEVGLSTSAIATLFFIARIWDAVNDPILGGIVDRTTPRKGKFLPWIKAVSILMPIVTLLTFYKISGNGTINLVYVYISYILWGMVYTVSDVPIFALATTMTDNVNERVTIMSIGRFAAGIAALVASVIAAPMIAQMGFSSTALILMAIAFITMLPVRFFVKERFIHKRKEEVTLRSMFRAVSKNKYLIAFYSAFIILYSFGTNMAVGVFFAKYNLGNISLHGVISAGSMLPMLIIPIFAPMLIRRIGKRKLFIISMCSGIIFSILQYLAGYENFGVFMILNILKSIGILSPMILMGMFSADCVEYGAYVTGVRNEGITFSVQTFSMKLGQAFSGTLGIFLLGKFGYIGNQVIQSQKTLEGIWLLTTLVPAIGLMLALIIFFFFYKLNESEVERMIGEMEERKVVTG